MSTTGSGGGSKRVAVMGGTFDPIHHGHLFAAGEVAARLGLEQVIFMPSGQPPHKRRPDLSAAEDRYQMTALAVQSNPGFAVSRLEIDREGPSYTLDTLRALRREGTDPDREIVFIIGADAVLEIASWHEPDAVLAACRVLAIHRPGYDLAQLAGTLGPQRAARVQTLAVPTLDISSTELRRRVAAGEPIRYLTPDPVVDYITRRGLYR